MIAVSHYLYRLVPSRPDMLVTGRTEAEAEIVDQHFAYLERLTKQGVVLMAGRTLNMGARTFGIVVFRAESDKEARLLMENDPAVRQRVMLAELFPFGLALWSENKGSGETR